MKLNLGCGPHYAKGWWNVDLVQSDEHDIHPDEIIEAGPRLPFEDSQFEASYVGHLIEHVPWTLVPDVFSELKRVTVDGGKFCIVGPDTKRTIQLYKDGREPWHMVEAVLEDDVAFMTEGQWEGARHQWNCYEERVMKLLAHHGYSATALDMTQPDLFGDWPVVAFTAWQFGIEVQL